jgi:hypothetical protein
MPSHEGGATLFNLVAFDMYVCAITVFFFPVRRLQNIISTRRLTAYKISLSHRTARSLQLGTQRSSVHRAIEEFFLRPLPAGNHNFLQRRWQKHTIFLGLQRPRAACITDSPVMN